MNARPHDRSAPRAGRAARQARRNGLIVITVLVLVAAARLTSGTAGCLPGAAAALPARQKIELRFDEIEILDGDTIKTRGHLVRFLGADTPEMDSPYLNGNQEPWASRSRDFVVQSMRGANRIELVVAEHEDRYGRLLGHVFLDGESLSLRLVRAGMAYQTISRYGHNGFESLAAEILAASDGVQPDFEEPAVWRSRNSLGN